MPFSHCHRCGGGSIWFIFPIFSNPPQMKSSQSKPSTDNAFISPGKPVSHQTPHFSDCSAPYSCTNIMRPVLCNVLCIEKAVWWCISLKYNFCAVGWWKFCALCTGWWWGGKVHSSTFFCTFVHFPITALRCWSQKAGGARAVSATGGSFDSRPKLPVWKTVGGKTRPEIYISPEYLQYLFWRGK